MKAAPWMVMVGGTLGTWLVTHVFVDAHTSLAVLAGLVGPMVAIVATSILVESAAKRGAAQCTPVLLRAFAAKMVFFALYVTVMLKGLMVSAIPFVISFTGSFLVLYFSEALLLRRLFANESRAAR